MTIDAAPDATQACVQNDRTLRTIRCRHCGCVTHWEPIPAEAGTRHGVHLGNFDPELIASVRVPRFDGADTRRLLDDRVALRPGADGYRGQLLGAVPDLLARCEQELVFKPNIHILGSGWVISFVACR